MTDPLEVLERLGRLHESGILSDEEFAAQKKRILEDTDGRATRRFGQSSRPGAARAWIGRHRWLVGGGAAAAMLGALFAMAVVLDLRDIGGPAETRAESRGNEIAAGEGNAGRDLHALLRFDDPVKCAMGQELLTVTETMARRQPNDLPGSDRSPMRLPGFEDPVVPGVERVAVDGSRTMPVVAQLRLAGGWHGLRFSELRTVTWPGTELKSVQLRFAATPAAALRALNGQGFDLPAVGQMRNADLGNRRSVAVGLEEVPGGSALTCITG